MKHLSIAIVLALTAGLFIVAPTTATFEQTPTPPPGITQECVEYQSVATVTLHAGEGLFAQYSINGNEWVAFVDGDVLTINGNATLRIRQAKYEWALWKVEPLIVDIVAIDCHEVIIKEVPVIKEVPPQPAPPAPPPAKYLLSADILGPCGDPRVKVTLRNEGTLPGQAKVIYKHGSKDRDGRIVKRIDLAPGQTHVTGWIWVRGAGNYVRVRDDYQRLLDSVRIIAPLPWGTGGCPVGLNQ